LTFLTSLGLFLFGGEVLHGFSFALMVGIIIGTYRPSRLPPLLIVQQDWRASKGNSTQFSYGLQTNRIRGQSTYWRGHLRVPVRFASVFQLQGDCAYT